jgi:hypothetical protein
MYKAVGGITLDTDNIEYNSGRSALAK